MSAFEYLALDREGTRHKGILEGDNERQVRQQLREKNWLPMEVQQIKEKKASSHFQWRGKDKLSTPALALLTRQLATLVNAGTPLESALQSVAKQSGKSAQRRILLAVRSQVLEGHDLATGLSAFPATFSPLYQATVSAGEHAGKLDKVLTRLADYLETRHRIQQKTGLALIYPAVLSAVAILVVIALLTYVVPTVVQVFSSTGQELPALTRGLIATSDFLQSWGLVLLIVLVLAFTGFQALLRDVKWKRRWHQRLLNTPLIQRFITTVETARFARTMSILIGSGVAALESLKIAQQVLDNVVLQEAMSDVARKVREGGGLSRSMADSGYFPPMMVELIGNGEASGQLPEMMERAAQTQEQELESATATALGLFEPLLILVMGAIVLVIVLAIMMPIFEMNQLAG